MYQALYRFFWGGISNHPGDWAPLQPRFGALQLLAFPKIKITFEREEISDLWWDLRKYNKAAVGHWENCVRSQGAYFEGDWGVVVLCTVFLISCMFFSKCVYFSYYMVGYFLDRLRVCVWGGWVCMPETFCQDTLIKCHTYTKFRVSNGFLSNSLWR